MVDAQPLRGRGTEHRHRLLRGRGIQVAALSDRDVERVQQAETGRLDAERVGVDFWDQWGAVHLAFDLAGLRHAFDGIDAGDHRRRHEWQLRGLAGEALSVGDRQQVRSQLVDLFQQPRLAGGGQAQHRDDSCDADRDPKRRQSRAQAPCAQPDAGDPGQIGRPQSPRGEVRDPGVVCGGIGDRAHRALTGLR